MLSKKVLRTTSGMAFITLMVFALSTLALTGCFSPWQGNENLGSITFNFGTGTYEVGTSASYYMASSFQAVPLPQSIVGRLTHIVTMERVENNSVVERIPPFSISGASHSEPATPGEWRINVISNLDRDELFAKSETTHITVVPGRSTSANISIILEYILINNRDDLIRLASGIDPNFPLCGKYILTSEINLNGIEWLPIGYSTYSEYTGIDEDGNPYDGIIIGNSNSFAGIFDGNHQIISNLTITRDTYGSEKLYALGFFGIVETNAVVRNVRLVGVNINVPISWPVGGLIGQNQGIVLNSNVTGVVSGPQNVGGLVGFNVGIIQNSFVAGSVYAEYGGVGGLVGYNDGHETGATVQNSYATNSVSGGSSAGGLVGLISGGTVRNCYATGIVSGNMHVGGLVGGFQEMDVPIISTITNNFAINPTVRSTNRPVGRIVGSIEDSAVIVATSNFALDTMGTNGGQAFDGTDLQTHGEDRTNAQLRTQSTYTSVGWRFGNNNDNPWRMPAGGGYPILWWQ